MHYVNESVVNMREAPFGRAKVVSQATYAEEVSIIKTENNWSQILTLDNYSGWVPSASIISRDSCYRQTIKTSRLSVPIYEVKDIEYGAIFILPFGTFLEVVEKETRWIKIILVNGLEAFLQSGDVNQEIKLSNKNDLCAFSLRFLGLPYIWGGRSSFGYDCSGFIQMLYSRLGIYLPRDSNQQVLDTNFKEIPLREIQPGDLIFFGQSEEKIMHVGMYNGNNSFIHSTTRENKPWLRISSLNDFEWSGHPEAYYPYRTARQYKKTRIENHKESI